MVCDKLQGWTPSLSRLGTKTLILVHLCDGSSKFAGHLKKGSLTGLQQNLHQE
jgi:hypothetical protein